MNTTWEAALAAVLKHEGGYIDHPSDPGGKTNLGVTQATWESWIGRPSSEKEMRSLTVDKVAPLYKQKYWNAIKGDDLPTGVDFCVFDAAVNSGPGRAIKLLQECVGTKVDGVIGPATLKAVSSFNPVQLIDLYCGRRLDFVRGLPTWPVFGKGWERRILAVREEAGKMMG